MTRSHAHDAVRIDARLVARRIADGFPEWADLPVEPVPLQGHDHRTFRLGRELCVRVPSRAAYAAHLRVEHVWLPRLAPRLPLPIPLPLALGEPSPELPWCWSVRTWLDGEAVDVERVDLTRLAEDLAAFLNALYAVDARGGPPPGPDSFHRGGSLAVYDAETRACIEDLRDAVDARRATAVWESALASARRGPDAWVHGDVAVGNLLTAQGRLSAVIDFGQSAVGDPACDVTVAWTLFAGRSREAFRRALAVDEGTWARGRGWGLWKALLGLRDGRRGAPAEAAAARRTIEAVLAEPR